MNLKGKKLLVLTGCNGAKDIIEYAKKKGVYTIATDYYKVSPVKDIADYRYDISTIDIESLYKIAIKHKVDGITTGTSEASTYVIMNLSQRLKVPFYATSEQMLTLCNKVNFKNLLSRFNVSTPKQYNCSSQIEYPVVVKPADSAGGKGISISKNKNELDEAYSLALQWSRSRQVVIEKCLKGLPEVFFNYTIVNGEISLSCGFDNYKIHKQKGLSGLPVINMLPSKRLKKYINDVHPKLVTAFKSIGLQNGVLSIQTFFDGKEFIVFEAGYRLGGGQMYLLINEVNGINHMEMLVNHALTGKMSNNQDILLLDNPYFNKPCCQYNMPLKPGRIRMIEGIDQIKKINGVINVTEVRKVGDVIKGDGTTSQLGVRIHLVSDSEEGLDVIIGQINNTLIIEDENGNDMFFIRASLGDMSFATGEIV